MRWYAIWGSLHALRFPRRSFPLCLNGGGPTRLLIWALFVTFGLLRLFAARLPPQALTLSLRGLRWASFGLASDKIQAEDLLPKKGNAVRVATNQCGRRNDI